MVKKTIIDVFPGENNYLNMSKNLSEIYPNCPPNFSKSRQFWGRVKDFLNKNIPDCSEITYLIFHDNNISKKL